MKKILSIASLVIISSLAMVGVLYAATTIGTNITTDGNLTINGNTALEGDLTVKTNSLVIQDATGYTGIGTTTPAGRLAIAKGTADSQPMIVVDAPNNYAGRILDLKMASTSKLVVTGAGKVGIGTSTPYSVLSISTSAQQASTTKLLTVASTTGSTLFSISAGGKVGIGYDSAQISDEIYLGIDKTPKSTTGDITGIYSKLDDFITSGSSVANYRAFVGRVETGTNSTANFTGYLYGAYLLAVHEGSGTVTTVRGSDNGAYLQGSGTITNAAGTRGFVYNQGAGTISDARAIDAYILTSSGKISTSTGVYIRTPSKTGAGSITINYGIYIENQTGASTNYAIYSVGGNSYLGGNLGIATTTPAGRLAIAKGTTNNQPLIIADAPSGYTGRLIDLKTASTTQFVVTGAGKVGIASSTPQATFSIGTTGSTTIDIKNLCIQTNSPNGTRYHLSISDAGTWNIAAGNCP